MKAWLWASLLAAALGAVAYAGIGAVLVLGEHAVALHGHFRWPSRPGDYAGLALLMLPVALPSALAFNAFLMLFCHKAAPWRHSAVVFAVLVLAPALVLAFPWYLGLIDHANDWRRGMALPAATCTAALAIWGLAQRRAAA